MSIKGRLTKLEQRRGALPWLTLKQDLRDCDLYRDDQGNEYRHGVNWPDETKYQLLVVNYEHNWRGDTAGDTIQLKWPEELR